MSRFGDLIRGASAPTPTPVPDPAVESVVEAAAEVEEEVKLIPYESDLSLHDMSKKELEEYGRTVGIELDRRHSKENLVKELEEYLTNS